MVEVLVTWGYAAVLSFTLGFWLLRPFGRRFGVCSYVMAGLLALNVYALYFSLFAGVGLAANLVAVFAAALAVFRFHREMAAFLREAWRRTGRGRLLFCAFLVFLLAYGSSRGYMHYDTGVYHAQSIRWIEEYGVAPGLANLHTRLGYNSAAFALCALFGGGGIGAPLHCLPGFFALLCAFKCTALGSVFQKGARLRVSHFLEAVCIFYLVSAYREFVAPASDYFAILILFFVTLSWTEFLEAGERDPVPYALLSLCLVWAVCVKFSAAPALLLVLHPAAILLRNGCWKRICCFLGLGVVIAFPWLARNVIISGWLFYPLSWPDLFPVDWKLPKWMADYDRREIQVYARGIYDVALYNTPFPEWFPGWFRGQNALDRAFVASDWVCLPIAVVCCVLSAWKAAVAGKGNPSREAFSGWAVLYLTAAAGFLFWQFGAPLVRYGYFQVLLLPAVTLGGFWVLIGGNRAGRTAFRLLLAVFLLYRSGTLANMVAEFAGEPYYLRQQPYVDGDAFTYEVDGVTIYVPLDRGQIGYEKFPSSPAVEPIRLRGESLRSGFRMIEEGGEGR